MGLVDLFGFSPLTYEKTLPEKKINPMPKQQGDLKSSLTCVMNTLFVSLRDNYCP